MTARQWAACCLFAGTLQIGPQWVQTQNGIYPVYSFPAGPADRYPLTIVGPGIHQPTGVFGLDAQTPSPPRTESEANTDGSGGSWDSQP